MTKLVLHIGTHKTATTSIQATLAKSRKNLRKAGIWYPAYSEVFSDMSDHQAHLGLAKGLMSDSRRFTPERVARFFEVLHQKAVAAKDVDTVLISSEPFYRGKVGDEGTYWTKRERYVRNVRSVIPFDDTQVVIVLRRQDDYLESLYNEHVKATRYSKDIWRFFSDYRSRFEYKQQIQLWSKYFPVTKVATFEELVKSANVTRRFLDIAVDGREVELTGVTESRNASLPIDLIEFKRLLNATPLSRPELAAVVNDLQAAAGARTDPEPGRRSRLSEADCMKVLAQFSDDNDWLNGTYFSARPEGLFPSGIRARQTVEPLDAQACAGIVAELLRTQAARRV
jgi:hypothetical protein